MPLTYPGYSDTNTKFALISGLYDYGMMVAVPTSETLSSLPRREHKLAAEGESIFPSKSMQSAWGIDGEKPFFHRVCKIDGEVLYSYDLFEGAVRRDMGDKVPGHGQGSALVLATERNAFLPQSFTSYQSIVGNWYYFYTNEISGDAVSGHVLRTQYEHEANGKVHRYIQTRREWSMVNGDPYRVKINETMTWSPGEEPSKKEYYGSVSYITVPAGMGYKFDQLLALIEENTIDLSLSIYSLKMNVVAASSSATSAALNAIEPLRATSLNNIENASQAVDDVRSVCDFLTKYLSRNFKPSPRAVLTLPRAAAKIANGYLEYRYALKPTVQDFKELKSYMEDRLDTAKLLMQSGQSVFRGSTATSKMGFTVEAHSKVRVGSPIQDDIDKVFNHLDALGLEPSFQRAWDLVPYSFVVDWLTNVGDMLTAIDVNSASHRFPIQCVTSSIKITAPSQEIKEKLTSDLIRVRDVRIETYERTVSSVIPPLPDVDLRGIGRGGHAIAGSALVITRLD